MATSSHNKSLGTWGEEFAAKKIQQAGGKILARNVRYAGVEVDIVFEAEKILVICEVKTRTSAQNGHPLEIITAEKLHRLQMALVEALSKFGIKNGRIDAFGIVLRPTLQIKHIQGIML